MAFVGAIFRKSEFAVVVLLQGSFGCPQERPYKRDLTLTPWCFEPSLRMRFEIDVRDLSTEIHIGLKKIYSLAEPHAGIA